MTPYLVTAPVSLPVSLESMKAHLRVVHDDDDDDITAKQAGAVAVLDAWGGVLGRCIMPQVWAIDVRGAGPHLLPFPDASEIAAKSGDDDLGAAITRSGAGLCVSVLGASSGELVTITATYGLPEPRVSAAETLIKLMVQREFDMMVGPEYDAITRSIDALVGALRWVRI